MSEGYEGHGGVAPGRAGQAGALDAIGARYDEPFPHKEGRLAAVDAPAKALPPGSRVLDVGRGAGIPTARTQVGAGHTVVGVDLSRTVPGLARAHVPEAEFPLRDLASLSVEGPAGLSQFGAVTCYFTRLMRPRAEISRALRTLRSLLRPGGLLSLSMVEADPDDAAIPFLGHTIRVSGYLREALRQVVSTAGLKVTGAGSYAHAPAGPHTADPEQQLFLNCRRA